MGRRSGGTALRGGEDIWRSGALALWLLGMMGDASGQNATDNSTAASTVFVDVTDTLITSGIAGQLVASRRTHCPVKCAAYEAGASADSPFVAQAVASGVDDLGKYADKGVVCFPPYNAASHWNICYQNTDTSVPIPKYTHAEICHELASTGGSSTMVHGSTLSAETTKGRWMSLDADLGCGWGSTLTHLLPSAVGGSWSDVHGYASPTVQTYNTASNDYECCLQAMAYEGTPKKQGGSAVRFEYTAGNNKCRVDREAMMLGNLDASSGLAMRDLGECNSGNAFVRHAAGSADASNLMSMGRCELKYGFTRLLGTSSASRPGKGFRRNHHFESTRGNELPNHACAGGWNHGGCAYVIGYNTINNAEECCQACVDLSWISETGGNVSTDPTTGELANPCLAWQITDGICTIMRREYAVYHNVATAKAYFENQGSQCTGDACNYYSHLRYREAGDAITPVAGTSSNATFTRVVTATVSADNSSLIIRANISGVGSNGGKYAALITSGDSEVAVQAFADDTASTATAQISIVESSALTQFDDQSTFLDTDHLGEQSVLCQSLEATKGGWLDFECSLASATSGQKTDGPVQVAIAFSSIGDGGDQMTFSNVKVLSGSGPFPSAGADAGGDGGSATSPAPACGIGPACVLAVVTHAFFWRR